MKDKSTKKDRFNGKSSGSLGTAKINTSIPEVLKLGYAPGTSGLGRIPATTKAGIRYEDYPSGSTPDCFCLDQKMVAAVSFTPTLGALWNDDQRLGLYSAILKYYTSLRERNASLAAYNQFDVIKCIYSVSQIYMMMAAIRTKLRVLHSGASQINSAIPTYLEQAYGIVSGDRATLNDLIGQYNRIVRSLRALFVPFDFRLGLREIGLTSTVYLDDPEIDKSQLIIFKPRGMWVWDVDATSATVGQLVFKADSSLSISQQLTYVEQYVNAYLLDSDVNNIYAEMRNAFGNVERLGINEFPSEGEPITLDFSQVMLDQLHNATMVGDIKPDDLYIIEDPSTGYLRYVNTYLNCQPIFYYKDGTGVIISGTSPLDGQVVRNPSVVFNPSSGVETGWADGTTTLFAHDDQPDEDNMAIITFWHARIGYGKAFPTSIGYRFAVYSHTTELINNVVLYGTPILRSGVQISNTDRFEFTDIFINGADINDLTMQDMGLSLIIKYLDFHYLPCFKFANYFHDANDVVGLNSMHHIHGDIDNMFTTAWRVIDSLHVANTQWLIGLNISK